MKDLVIINIFMVQYPMQLEAGNTAKCLSAVIQSMQIESFFLLLHAFHEVKRNIHPLE